METEGASGGAWASRLLFFGLVTLGKTLAFHSKHHTSLLKSGADITQFRSEYEWVYWTKGTALKPEGSWIEGLLSSGKRLQVKDPGWDLSACDHGWLRYAPWVLHEFGDGFKMRRELAIPIRLKG